MVILIILYSPLVQSFEQKTIYLGESFSLPIGPKEQIKLSVNGILSSQIYENKITFTGKKEGTLMLMGDRHALLVHVRSRGQSDFLSILKNLPGIDYYLNNNEVTIKGHILSLNDWIKIINEKPGNIKLNLRFEIPPTLKKELMKFINQRAQSLNLADIELSNHAPYHFIVKNEKVSASEKKLLEPFGLKVYPLKEDDRNENFLLSLAFLEIKSTFNKTQGISWPQSLSLQPFHKFNLLQTEDPLLAQIQFLENNGQGKLHAIPRINLFPGKVAVFHSGGEIPIKVQSYSYQRISFKKYGLILKTEFERKPHYFTLKLDLETSQVDPNYSTADAPGFSIHRSQTELKMKLNQIYEVSGLLREQQGNNESGLRYLSQIPILGTLLRSESYLSGHTKLMVIAQLKKVNHYGK